MEHAAEICPGAACSGPADPTFRGDPVYGPIAAFVDQLVRGGVAHFCVAPGARSTPLAFALARRADVRVWSHVDERCAAFFALGAAKTSRQPAAIVCTSGTAAAHCFPAVIEARYAHVPLIVLTADRPPELRDCGAPQTIDQLKLYGDHVKWFAEAGPAELGAPYLRSLAARAAAIACARPPGPVHLNLPFREPLVPGEADHTEPSSAGPPAARAFEPLPFAAPSAVAAVVAAVRQSRRGLIVCGPADTSEEDAASIAHFAAQAGFPVLADPLSQMRCGAHAANGIIDCYDALLRDERFASAAAPDLILRIGALPRSKPLLHLLQRSGAEQIVVDPLGQWSDPTLRAGAMVTAAPGPLLAAVASELPACPRPSQCLGMWERANRAARRALDEAIFATGALLEPRAVRELADLIPNGALLYVGNSMPVRDVESFWPRRSARIRFLCNHGANGIDGFLSSGLGAAAVHDAPVVLLTGDLGFYHDLNGLLAAKRHGLRAIVVLLNNDGGGIFSFLPQAQHGPGFEELFLTPHGLDFRHAAALYGAGFARISAWDDLRIEFRRALDAPRCSVIEVPTDRDENVAWHHHAWQRVGRALETL